MKNKKKQKKFQKWILEINFKHKMTIICHMIQELNAIRQTSVFIVIFLQKNVKKILSRFTKRLMFNKNKIKNKKLPFYDWILYQKKSKNVNKNVGNPLVLVK